MMAVLKKKQIREMEANERDRKIGELRLELMKEKGHIAVSGAVANPGKIRETRKTIARLLTQKNMKKKI
ncbi:50S ribosomal protein L29 [archaeon]|nr:MAG: 50S ribosomal protein L29 [archaeon]